MKKTLRNLVLSGTMSLALFIGCDNSTEQSNRIPKYEQIAVDSQGYKSGAVALDMGDVDNDGTKDLVLGDLKNIRVYFNRNGEFRDNRIISYVDSQGYKSGALALRLCDIDNDVDLDLVFSDLKGISIFYNDGKGNFSQR